MGHRRHAVRAEQVGEQPHHHLAVFQHIAHAAGYAQVVFEHVVLAVAFGVRRTHDVDAGNVGVNLVRHIHTHHLGAELGVALNLVTRHDAGFQNFLVVVDVVDEAVKRIDTLHQPLFHAGPLVGRNDARNQVKRDQALGAGAVLVFFAVDGEGNAHSAEDHLRFFTAFGHHVAGLASEPFVVNLVVVSYLAALAEKFIRELGVHLVEFLHVKDLSDYLLCKLRATAPMHHYGTS